MRQGDPLSSFLFIITMEGLNIAMKVACQKGIFHGIKILHSEMMISHLFYIDDVVFVGEWSQDSIRNLSRVLRCFQVALGLKVNFNKSRIFGIGVDIPDVTRWVAPLGRQPASLPFTYLGVPVGSNMKLKKHWKPIIDRFYAKLPLWKSKTLSFGGRLTLAEALLGSLPSYFFLFICGTGGSYRCS